MKECARKINVKMISMDKILRKPLLEIREICNRMEGVQFFEHRFTSCLNSEEFNEVGEEY